MDPAVKRRGSVHKFKPVSQSQQNLERPTCDQEFICAKTQEAAMDSLEGFFKVRQSVLENTDGTIDEQVMKSLQRIFSTDPLNKETVNVHETKYERNSDPQKLFQKDHNSKSSHLPFSYMIRSNSTRAVECSSKPSQVIFKDIAKCRERSSVDKSSSFKGKRLDFFEIVKEQLQQKDLENQHLIHLLLVRQKEIKDITEISKQKEKETLLMTEKLKSEEQRNTEIKARFEHTAEEMKKELSEAKRNNKNVSKQLKALLEKYERLKTRANAVKDQLNVELKEKRSLQKTLKGLKQFTQEMMTKQKHLEEQRDAAAKDLSLYKETLRMKDEEHKRNMSINQRLEDEVSALRTESANLRDHLCKAQEKNKELIQLARSKESEKEKNSKESKDMIERLKTELSKCQKEKDKVHQQVEAIKQESKLIHIKQREEMLHLEEQQKGCQQKSEGFRRECETLMEMVNNLKIEKQIVTDKLETVQKEKRVSEMSWIKDEERLKEAIRLLEHERTLLLAEMEDLRNDYVGISDRITQKISHMCAADPPMANTDITFNHYRKTQKKICGTDDVIKNIRRKLEEEDLHQS